MLFKYTKILTLFLIKNVFFIRDLFSKLWMIKAANRKMNHMKNTSFKAPKLKTSSGFSEISSDLFARAFLIQLSPCLLITFRQCLILSFVNTLSASPLRMSQIVIKPLSVNLLWILKNACFVEYNKNYTGT